MCYAVCKGIVDFSFTFVCVCVYLSNGILKDLELEDDTLLLFIILKMCITNHCIRGQAENRNNIPLI